MFWWKKCDCLDEIKKLRLEIELLSEKLEITKTSLNSLRGTVHRRQTKDLPEDDDEVPVKKSKLNLSPQEQEFYDGLPEWEKARLNNS